MLRRATIHGAVALSILGLGGCEQGPRVEGRTFQLEHLPPHEAEALIVPYVYQDRPGAGGMWSAAPGAITVRETPDNLDRIARVLAEADVPRPDVRLHFQLIEADGFTEVDPRIADVTDELRRVFQFRGYRLASEAVLVTSTESEITQSLAVPADMRRGRLYERLDLMGSVHRISGSAVRLEEIRLIGYPGATQVLQTTVNVRPGQTIVLGSSPSPGSDSGGALLLTVRAEWAS